MLSGVPPSLVSPSVSLPVASDVAPLSAPASPAGGSTTVPGSVAPPSPARSCGGGTVEPGAAGPVSPGVVAGAGATMPPSRSGAGAGDSSEPAVGGVARSGSGDVSSCTPCWKREEGPLLALLLSVAEGGGRGSTGGIPDREAMLIARRSADTVERGGREGEGRRPSRARGGSGASRAGSLRAGRRCWRCRGRARSAVPPSSAAARARSACRQAREGRPRQAAGTNEQARRVPSFLPERAASRCRRSAACFSPRLALSGQGPQ